MTQINNLGELKEKLESMKGISMAHDWGLCHAIDLITANQPAIEASMRGVDVDAVMEVVSTWLYGLVQRDEEHEALEESNLLDLRKRLCAIEGDTI